MKICRNFSCGSPCANNTCQVKEFGCIVYNSQNCLIFLVFKTKMSFYDCLIKTSGAFTRSRYKDHDLDTKVGIRGTTVRTFKIFLHSIWSNFAYIHTLGIQSHGYREPNRGSMGFLKVSDLYWSNYMPWKLCFKKYISLMWVFQFLIVTHNGKGHIPLTLTNFGILQLFLTASKKVF